MINKSTRFKPVDYETLEWKSQYDTTMLSRQTRKSIVDKYDAAIPSFIANNEILLSKDTQMLVDDALLILGRFDTFIKQKEYDFPALLLRSESASSSQIENLTASARNIAWAELSKKAPENSQIIAGNIVAMQKAIENSHDLSVHSIKEIHKSLLSFTNPEIAGILRKEPVWIGGTGFGPGGAEFVPPKHSRIPNLLDDLVKFGKRGDLNFIAKAAILHAQFETIHPFADGNGRTGRTLIHVSLMQDQVLLNAAIPLSAGILHDVNGYFNALKEYHNGNIEPMVIELAQAIVTAAQIGSKLSERIDLIIQMWRDRIKARYDSSIWKLLMLLVKHPVISAGFVSHELQISERSAGIIIEQALSTKIIHKIGNAHKGIFYEAKEITKLLDVVSGSNALHRLTTN